MTGGGTTGGRQAVFLDRDGTIAYYTEYCSRPEEFRLLPTTGAAIRLLNQAGLLVIVTTNQSGIARGLFTQETLDAIHQKMRRELKEAGARVDAIYLCPHHPDDGCTCRKPGIAMFQQASAELGISLDDSYAVGDRLLDIASGHAAGCTTVLVRSGHPPEPDKGVLPDYEAATLVEAAQWILRAPQLALRRGRPRMAIR